MNIIIVGCGKVGEKLTALLSSEGHNVTIIDSNANLVENIVNEYDVQGLCDNGASAEVLGEAGCSQCHMFIAVTGSDELNIMCCLFAKKLGAKYTIARVRRPEYFTQSAFMRDQLGIGLIINPDFEAADEIARIIEFPAATKIETFSKGRIELAEIIVSKESSLVGVMLCDLRKTFNTPMLICAVQRGEEVIIPSGNFVIEAGDKIHFTASKLALPKVFKTLGMDNKKIRSVLIIGGSRTSYYLARHLLKSGLKVKIIENNATRAAKLEAELEGATIICGDGTDSELLKEEGIRGYDATVALTDIDEENIIFSAFAARNGVDKTVCKINRQVLIEMLPSFLEECSVISPNSVVADIILRYVRSINNAEGNDINKLYRIIEEKAEALEFIANKNCKLLNLCLKDCTLKPNVIVACICRRGKVIIPDGFTAVEEGDSVIVITAGQTITNLNDILDSKE